MYKLLKIEISENDELYPYLANIAKLSNNLYNATLFRVRQLMSSRSKIELTQNEIKIIDEVVSMNQQLSALGKKERPIPPSGAVGYNFLDDLLKYTRNADYMHHDLPCHTAQAIIKQVTQNMKSFFETIAAYQQDPTKFTGKPKLPHYKHKGGISTFKFSNQECKIKETKRGKYYAKLPYTKSIIRLGNKVNGRLKEVTVSHNNNRFLMIFIFDDGQPTSNATIQHKNICAIDLGLNNLMAVTNNMGLPNILYKGGYLKSINHNYNKTIANIVSVNTKGSDDKYEASKRYSGITNKRNNQINDYISKVAKHFIKWCVEKRIDTIVIGKNDRWKDEMNLGYVTNQNFVQIPHARLVHNIKYRANIVGIDVIINEESYTSKSSYLDRDFIPVYDKENEEKYQFSGKRIKRGLYRSKDGTIINADFNGSANIMRKVFEDVVVKFDKVVIIKNVNASLSRV